MENKEWKTRKGWRISEIRSEAKSGMLVIWIFAVIGNGIIFPLLFAFPRELEKGNYAVLIALIFPALGVYLLCLAVLKTVQFRRYGKVLFEMDPYPGAIGGHVGGQVQVSRLPYVTATDSSSVLLVRLECVYSYESGSGDSRRRKEDIKWAEEGSPHLKAVLDGVNLGFRFDVPDNLPEADFKRSSSYYFWRLTVKADIRGVDLYRQYDIPVFKTGERSCYVGHDISAQVAKRKNIVSKAAKESIALGNFDIDGLSRCMRYSEYEGEIQLRFPMFRNKVPTVFAAIFAGGFGFACYSLTVSGFGAGLFGIVRVLFCLPFFLVAFPASVAVIYLPFNNLSVRISVEGIAVLRRLLFVPIFRRDLKASDIAYLALKHSGRTGQGVDEVKHYKLLAHDNRGGSVIIAEGLDGEDVAMHFCNHLALRLNVESRVLGTKA